MEAAVVIVSLCASTLDEAPRGAGFLLRRACQSAQFAGQKKTARSPEGSVRHCAPPGLKTGWPRILLRRLTPQRARPSATRDDYDPIFEPGAHALLVMSLECLDRIQIDNAGAVDAHE
jgi:hypothetical protein